MGQVAVVSDTTHYLPREVADANALHQVSLYVHWRGRQDRESELDGYDEYYEHLRVGAELPTTSQPSIGDFLAVWEPLLEAGHDVVSIHLAGGISGTCASALQARQALAERRGGGERVTVLDSQTACGGLAFIVLAASAAARTGADSEAVVARAQAARESAKVWFCLDTLEYLRRGGRIGAARAWLGSTLRIKPILTLEQEITPVERVRTSARALERMAEYLEARHRDGADGWAVQHIRDPERAEKLVEHGRALFGSEPVFVGEVGPVIGTHVGPGLLGVGGLPRALLQ
jgi:DegV family protein with EDD domain